MQTQTAAESRILFDTLTAQYTAPTRLNETISDSDGVTYRISTPLIKTTTLVSCHWSCFPQLAATNLCQSLYSGYIVVSEEGFNLTLKLNMLEISPESAQMLFQKISLLKRNLLSAPFERAINAYSILSTSPSSPPHQPIAIQYRHDESIYICPSHDRITVIFSVLFQDDNDKVLGKVFLQEFCDARKNGALGNAPQVIYSPKAVPGELTCFGIAAREEVNYVTFVLFPRQITPERAQETITKIMLFRGYLHYHIKCSKSYLHSRMRGKVAEFSKVLMRAKVDKSKKKATTISGRTFVRG